MTSEIACATIDLGIVCPMANEAETAERFVVEVLECCAGFGFRSVRFFASLDRASRDDTLELMRAMAERTPELSVVFAPENRGPVDAYLRVYAEALEAGCDWVLEIDAGFSHRPEQIPRFFAAMAEGHDCVFGSRYCPGGRAAVGAWRGVVSRGGTMLANLLLGTSLTDMTSGFELFRADALRLILDRGIHSCGPFFQTEIRAYAHGLSIREVPIHYDNPSQRIGPAALWDSARGLWRLWRGRSAWRGRP